MSEPREHKVKRLRMRSIRRGIKEMDIILGNFSETELATMSDDALTVYDRMLSENDHDLYAWICGTADPLPEFAQMIDQVGAHMENAHK